MTLPVHVIQNPDGKSKSWVFFLQLYSRNIKHQFEQRCTWNFFLALVGTLTFSLRQMLSNVACSCQVLLVTFSGDTITGLGDSSDLHKQWNLCKTENTSLLWFFCKYDKCESYVPYRLTVTDTCGLAYSWQSWPLPTTNTFIRQTCHGQKKCKFAFIFPTQNTIIQFPWDLVLPWWFQVLSNMSWVN